MAIFFLNIIYTSTQSKQKLCDTVDIVQVIFLKTCSLNESIPSEVKNEWFGVFSFLYFE